MGKKLGKSVAWDFLLNAKMREKVSRALKRTRGGGEADGVEKEVVLFFTYSDILTRASLVMERQERERGGGSLCWS